MTTKTGIQELPLAQLFAHPLNPRPKILNGTVDELAASIKERGQLQPLVVRARSQGTYEILVGHRRCEALRRLERDTAIADVREADDAEALAILLTEQKNHEDVDPFLEATAVEDLVKQAGSVRRAAALVGESPRWVAQRRSLLQLSAAWQKRRKDAPWSGWPIAVWETLARLAPEAQEELAAKSEPGVGGWDLLNTLGEHALHPDLAEIERLVGEQLRVLGTAPFDVNDAKLVRSCGPCGSCPKTSQSVPGLFDEGEPVDLSSATCRDGACWAKKVTAALRARVDVVSKSAGEKVPVVLAKGAAAPGLRALREHEWKPAKEKDKGARQVASVQPDGSVKVAWAKVIERRPSPAAASTDSAPVEAAGARLKRLEDQHRNEVQSAVTEGLLAEMKRTVDKDEVPAAGRVLALVIACGCLPPYGETEKQTRARWQRAQAALDGTYADLVGSMRLLWRDCHASIEQDPDLHRMFTKEGDDALERLMALCMGLDFDRFRQEIEAKVKPSADLVKARAAVGLGDAPASPADPGDGARKKKARGKGAAAGDPDADEDVTVTFPGAPGIVFGGRGVVKTGPRGATVKVTKRLSPAKPKAKGSAKKKVKAKR